MIQSSVIKSTPIQNQDAELDLFAFADQQSASVNKGPVQTGASSARCSDEASDDRSASEAEMESGARGKSFRERRDIVTGEIMDEAQLLRLAIAPDGTIVPDVAAKLPGRGIWIACDTDSVKLAMKKGAFARAAKSKVKTPDDLPEQCAQALKRRLFGLLGMALRSGQLEMGYDKVRGLIAAEPPAWRIAANDAARDGRNKIRMASKAAWNATPLLACFSSAELGAALGREDVTHAALREGHLADTLEREALRFCGFTPLIPSDWVTEHEDFALWLAQKA